MAQSASANDIALRNRLRQAVERKKFNQMDFYEPYPKQLEFFAQGVAHRERTFFAGNQLGKTTAGAFEATCHATGRYPSWWNGRRFDKPTRGWLCGPSNGALRDGAQQKLLGTARVEEAFGTGMIPRDCLVETTSARGTPGSIDTIQVRHVSGGVSTISLKSYEQGREKFQSDTIDWFWADEEPPYDIYTELLARITATHGMGWITFTPLLGRTPVVDRFLNEENPSRAHVIMTFEEVSHLTDEQRKEIWDSYPAHMREARTRGVPMAGEGMVFSVAEDTLKEPRIDNVPIHWAKIWGVDFGIAHPFAAVLLAWDKDYDTIHVLHTIRMSDGNAIMHGHALRQIAAAVPVAWPQDGTQRDKGSGEQLADIYRRQGKLPMLGTHATHADGSVSTEAGVMEMETRMQTGRLKVADHLGHWFEEFRGYHRKEGQIVKEHDDIMSATRIGLMMRRYARPVGLGGGKAPTTWRGHNPLVPGAEDYPTFLRSGNDDF